jgi:hypothetical protein
MTEVINLGGKMPLPAPKSESKSTEKMTEPDTEALPEPPEIPMPEPELKFADLAEDLPPMPEVKFELPMSEHEKLRRRQLLVRIKKYKSTFPEITSDVDTTDMRDLPLHELEVLAEDVEFLVSVRQSAGAAKQLFLSGVTVAETIGKPIGLKLNGLTNVCAANADLLQIVDECAIKYGDQVSIGPEVRLSLLLIQLVTAVHQHNKTLDIGDEPKPIADNTARDKLMKDL